MDGWQIETEERRAKVAARAVWARRAADVTLFVVLASSFYQTSEQGKNQPVPYDLLLIAGMALFFAFGLRFPRRLAWPATLWGLVLVGYGIGGMSAIYLDRLESFLQAVGYLICTFIFFASCVYEAPEKRLPVLFNGYTAAALIAAGTGVGGYFGLLPESLGFTHFGRADGTFNDPNVFGPYLIAPSLYLGLRMSKARGGRALMLLAPFGLLVLGILLSFSRGAWGNFLLSGIVFIWLTVATSRSHAQSMRLVGFSVLMSVVVVAIVAVALSTPKIQQLFAERAALVQDYDVGKQGRFESQKQAIKTVLERPLGIGPSQWAMINKLDTHNVYLNILVGGGFLSGLAFLVFVGSTLLRGGRAVLADVPGRECLIVVFAATVGHLAEAVIIDVDNWRHLFLLFGMLWGGILAVEARRSDGRNPVGAASRRPARSGAGTVAEGFPA